MLHNNEIYQVYLIGIAVVASNDNGAGYQNLIVTNHSGNVYFLIQGDGSEFELEGEAVNGFIEISTSNSGTPVAVLGPSMVASGTCSRSRM